MDGACLMYSRKPAGLESLGTTTSAFDRVVERILLSRTGRGDNSVGPTLVTRGDALNCSSLGYLELPSVERSRCGGGYKFERKKSETTFDSAPFRETFEVDPTQSDLQSV